MVDVLFANEQEILTLTQSVSFEEAQEKARALAKTVVLTRSEKGAVVLQGATTTAITVTPVDKVVDATGAGDQFAAGFLFGYLSGASLQQAGQLGALAAAEVISHIGARPQQPLKNFCAKVGLAA
jgi:sugar/nucleoside kinase (ribokinase family)